MGGGRTEVNFDKIPGSTSGCEMGRWDSGGRMKIFGQLKRAMLVLMNICMLVGVGLLWMTTQILQPRPILTELTDIQDVSDDSDNSHRHHARR
jgi:hypothetical protein